MLQRQLPRKTIQLEVLSIFILFFFVAAITNFNFSWRQKPYRRKF